MPLLGLSRDGRDAAARVCAIAMLAIVLPVGGALAQSSDFTELITDPLRVLSVPNLPRPGYLQTVEDTLMNTSVTRITGDPNSKVGFDLGGWWGPDARHHIFTSQPWNADGSLIALQNKGAPTALFLDGETYEVLRGRCPGMGGEERWHPSLPTIRIGADGAVLRWYDVLQCAEVRRWTLPFAVNGIGPSYGNPSADGRFVALTDMRQVIVVDMASHPELRVGPAYDLRDCGLPGGCAISWVSISPSGRFVVVDYDGSGERVFDVDPETLALTPRPMPESSPRCGAGDAAQGFVYDVELGDLTRNPFDGDADVLVGREHCGNRGKLLDGALIGGFVMVRLSDGAVTSLTDPRNEAYPHMASARNVGRPGWVYASYYAQDGKRFTDEIVAIKMDGSQSVQRFAHRRSVFKGCYRCTPHAVPSPDGRRVLWASNWVEDCTTCGEPTTISAFVADARGDDDPPPPNVAPEGAIVGPASDVTIFAGDALEFAADGSDADGDLPLGFTWTFGGGVPDAEGAQVGPLTFATPGTYTVTLTATDARGLADPTPDSVHVTVVANQAPDGTIADLPADTTLVEGDALTFAASAADPDGHLPLAYAWTFGGAAEDTNAEHPGAVTFATPGVYTVTLTVTDARGLADPSPDTLVVTVLANQAPEGEIAGLPSDTTLVTGDALAFASSAADPDGHLPLAFAWTFGGAAEDTNAEHPGAVTFAAAGEYVVTLTVADARGLADPTPDAVRVTVRDNQPPNAEIAGLPADTTLFVGDALTFAATGHDPEGESITYRWTFGGAAPDAVGPTPGTVWYSGAGVYAVTLTATDARGLDDPTPDECVVTVVPRTVVNQPPDGTIAGLPADTTLVEGSAVLEFSASGDDPDGDLPLQFAWSFGGAAPDATGEAPGRVWFDTPGTYLVTLATTDARGAEDPTPDAIAVTVTPAPPNVSTHEVHWTFTGPTSVAMNWREGLDFVRVGRAPGRYDRKIVATPPPPPRPISSPGPFREALIEGLEPGTEYHYSIGYGTDHVFHTPPEPGPQEFTIYVAGDIGSTIGFPRSIPGLYRLVAEGQPKFFLGLGDLTYGNPHGQAAVEQHFDDMMVWSQDAAYMPIWGNHEWDKPNEDDLRNYKGRFALPNPQRSPGSPAVSCCGEDWYWFDYGHVRFIGLPEPWDGAFADWNAKAEILMAQAQADPNLRFIVTFGHRPTYSSGSKSSHMSLRGYLDAFGTRYSKYKLDLSGHAHHYERSHPQHGVTHILAGGGGAGLQSEDGSCRWRGGCPPPAWSAYRALRHSVVRLTFSENAIDGWAICGPADEEDNDISCGVGTPFDHFRIGEGAPPDTIPAANLAPNPSFELSLDGWTPYGRATLARVAQGFDGDWAAEVVPADGVTEWVGLNDAPNIVDVDGFASHYYYSAWVRTTAGAGNARLRVRSYLNGKVQGTLVNSATKPLTSEWQPLGVSYPTPPTGSTIDFQILFQPTSPGTRFLADEVVVEVNGGFDDDGMFRTGAERASAESHEHGEEHATAAPLPTRFEAAPRPMPMRGSGVLRLAVTRSGPVDAALFDVHGRRVRALATGRTLAPGHHELAIDGRDDAGGRLAPGVYLYRVRSAEGTLTGRCVLMP